MEQEVMEVSEEVLVSRIYVIRGKKVMFDRDLANLYGVSTRALNQAVQRNIARFPGDFMFKLDREENNECSRSQFVTLKRGKNIKYLPYVFTEQGVAMLSGVLHSDRAISVNIQIMRMFAKLRSLLASHEELKSKVDKLEQEQSKKFKTIFDVLKLLVKEDEKPKEKIGFRVSS